MRDKCKNDFKGDEIDDDAMKDQREKKCVDKPFSNNQRVRKSKTRKLTAPFDVYLIPSREL